MINMRKEAKCSIIVKAIVLLLLFAVNAFAYSEVKNSKGYKFALVFLLNIVILLCVLWIDHIHQKIKKNKRIMKIANVALFLGTPAVMFVFTEVAIGSILSMSVHYILLNLLLYYILYFVFILLFRQVKMAVIVYSVFFMILMLIQYFVFYFRGRPFVFLDMFAITTAVTVAGFYTYQISVRLCVCIQCLMLFWIVQFHFQQIEWGRGKKTGLIRFMGLLFCGIVIGETVSKEISGELELDLMNMWDLQMSYEEQGLLYSLFCEIQYISPGRPDQYSVENVKQIVDGIDEKTQEGKQPDNLIVIMNESFADLETIGPIKTETELLPFTRNLKENTKKGWLHVPVFGAGTADSEYEVLTGNSKQFHPFGTVAYQLYVHNPEEGLASKLKEQGYYTIAVHPYYAANWNRNNVYEDMKFDEFISIENWEDPIDTVLWSASDETAYNKIIKLTEEKKQGEKQFIFLVTMQNHDGYNAEEYGYQPTVKLNYETAYSQAEVYLSAINESDTALKGLIEYFSETEESTMIVMFGDHQPAVEESFYEELFGKAISDLSFEEVQLRYKVPYLIWTNYAVEPVSGQVMSSNFFGSYILQEAGLKGSQYDQFLLNLKESIPVIGFGEICDAAGVWYPFGDMPEEYEELVNQYNILEYNNVFDYRNRVSSVFALAAQ